MNPQWKPAVTVAAVIEQDGLFFMIEEETSQGLKLNQPAGHLEAGESLLQAVAREALEESAHLFTPTALIGTYLIRKLATTGKQHAQAEHEEEYAPCYLRFAFCGELGAKMNRALDTGIVRTLWLSRDEIAADPARLRSPMVLRCIDDYLAGQRAPLSLIYTHESIAGADA